MISWQSASLFPPFPRLFSSSVLSFCNSAIEIKIDMKSGSFPGGTKDICKEIERDTGIMNKDKPSDSETHGDGEWLRQARMLNKRSDGEMDRAREWLGKAPSLKKGKDGVRQMTIRSG